MRVQGTDLFGDTVHGSRKNNHVSLLDRTNRVKHAFINGPHGDGTVEADLLSADAQDPPGYPAALGGQTDRAADQSDADDSQGRYVHSSVQASFGGGDEEIIASRFTGRS